MATVKKRRYCKDCGRKTLHEKEVFSGGMGLVLSILTLGLFIPLWGFIMVGDMCKPVMCPMCGKSRR